MVEKLADKGVGVNWDFQFAPTLLVKSLIFLCTFLPGVCLAEFRIMPLDGRNHILLTSEVGCPIPDTRPKQELKTVGYFVADGQRNKVCWRKERNQYVIYFRQGNILNYPVSKFRATNRWDYARKYGN